MKNVVILSDVGASTPAEIAEKLRRYFVVKGGVGSGNFGHGGRPGEQGGSSRFDTEATNEEIKSVLQRIPHAKPLTVELTDDQVAKYADQYDLWEKQASTDWDRITQLKNKKLFAPVVLNGSTTRWWVLDGSHRLAILAKEGARSVVAYFDNPKVYAGEES